MAVNVIIGLVFAVYALFNKEILANYSLPNPQELVQNNEWTYEKFFQLCEGVYVDLNGNQQKDEEDQFGYMSSGIHVDPWFYGAGNLLVEKDGDPLYEGTALTVHDFTNFAVFDAL